MSSSTCAVQVTNQSSCRACKQRKALSFCDLPAEALAELDRIKKVRDFLPGERLFTEGQAVDELMIVCEGAATLTFSGAVGSVMMLGLSENGEVLGLSSALSGHRHETTAEALTYTRVTTIPLNDFMKFVARFPEVAQSSSVELSRKVNRAYTKIRLVASGLSVPQRLAAWLLRLLDSDDSNHLKITLTHEKIAQLLGVTRESITRALSILKKLGVIEVRGIHFYVRNRSYLESLLQPAANAQTKLVAL